MVSKIKESFGYSEIEQLEKKMKDMDAGVKRLMGAVSAEMAKGRNNIKPFFSKDLESSPRLFEYDPKLKHFMIILKQMQDKLDEVYNLWYELNEKSQ
jgi:hypothetical protein